MCLGLQEARSGKVELHRYAVSLHMMYYGSCKTRTTLTKERQGIATAKYSVVPEPG